MRLLRCLFACSFLCLTLFSGADTIRHIDLICNDLVYDPHSNRIFASIPGSVGPSGNSIIPINPDNGMLGIPIPVGSEPGGMAVSDDGKYLYVALGGIGEVRRVDLATRKAGIQFPVGGARSLAVVPGQSNLLVVSRGGGAGMGGGVAVFDNGVLLPDAGNPNSFAFSIATRLHTYQNEISSWDFNTYDIGPKGLIGRGSTGSLMGGNNWIRGDGNGRIYNNSGSVIDPETKRVLGHVPTAAYGAMPLPDPSTGRIFYFEGNRVKVFDYVTFVTLGTYQLDGVPNSTDNFIRWGKDGVAFRTDKQVFFVNSAFVGKPVTPVDLSVTATHRPLKAQPGHSLFCTLTVVNKGLGAATNVMLTQALPDGLQYVSGKGPEQGMISSANSTVLAQIGDLKPGERAVVTLELKPVDYRKFYCSVVVRADQPDAHPLDNSIGHVIEGVEMPGEEDKTGIRRIDIRAKLRPNKAASRIMISL